jgi:flagellar basal-body rod protein FlgB
MFKNRLPLLNKGLDAYALRQSTTARNIANATTPNYVPEKVKFEELFNAEQISLSGSKTDEKHIPIGSQKGDDIEPTVANSEIPSPEIYFEGDSHINIDKEMSIMAENQIRFKFASQMTKNYFAGLSSAIRGTSQ